MNKETTIEAGTLSASLVKAFAEIEGATKDKVNPHFKSKYADIGSVIDAIKPILAKYDLAFTQHPQPSENGIIVETILHHAGGDKMSLGTLYVPANKNDAQAFGSALTYARRYALMTAFGVPAEDDDGNAAARGTTATLATTNGNGFQDRKRKLEGTYDTIPKLETAAKEFIRTLGGISDLDDFNEWGNSEDVVDFVAQLKRDLPDWWAGGPSLPGEFVPIRILIAEKKRDLEQIDDLRSRERTVLDAG